MADQLDYAALRRAMRMSYSGDPWGEASAWLFAAVEILHHLREVTIPDALAYRPSPLGYTNEHGAYETEICEAASTEALWRLMNVLYRARRLLLHKDMGY